MVTYVPSDDREPVNVMLVPVIAAGNSRPINWVFSVPIMPVETAPLVVPDDAIVAV